MIERTFKFKDEFVTCLACACNYTEDENTPAFCQKFKFSIRPRDIYENMQIAKGCKEWIPHDLKRHWIDGENQ